MMERRDFDPRGDHERPSSRIENATTLMRTAALAERGIDHVRVLSESKFLGLVRSMVDESMTQHLDGVGAEAGASAPPARANGSHESEGAYQKKWEELRARHEKSLERIETGMRRLGATFEAIKETLARWNAGEAAAPAAVGPVEETPRLAPPVSHKTLLREMLL
jgi:hypothetical protein